MAEPKKTTPKKAKVKKPKPVETETVIVESVPAKYELMKIKRLRILAKKNGIRNWATRPRAGIISVMKMLEKAGRLKC